MSTLPSPKPRYQLQDCGWLLTALGRYMRTNMAAVLRLAFKSYPKDASFLWVIELDLATRDGIGSL